MNEFDLLKGKKIKSIQFSDKLLRFILESNEEMDCLYEAQGECCSISYIEDLDNPEIFTDSTFISVESVEGESKDDGYEVHKWTFYKFKTSKGICTLSFRNDSNGYYNGELALISKNKITDDEYQRLVEQYKDKE